MGDDDSRIRKHFTAGDMIFVVMAVNEVFHRLIKTPFEFTLQPVGHLSVDRIRDDDSVRRYQKTL